MKRILFILLAIACVFALLANDTTAVQNAKAATMDSDKKTLLETWDHHPFYSDRKDGTSIELIMDQQKHGNTFAKEILDSLKTLAIIQKNSSPEEEKNKALSQLRASAENDNVIAQELLANVYENLEPQDHTKAFHYYSLAAKSHPGGAMAEFNLAKMYATGSGVPVNENEFVRWLKLSAQHGDPTAQEALIKYNQKASEHGQGGQTVNDCLAKDLSVLSALQDESLLKSDKTPENCLLKSLGLN